MCVNSASTTPKSGSAGNQHSDDLNDGDGTHPGLARAAENKHEMQLGRGHRTFLGKAQCTSTDFDLRSLRESSTLATIKTTFGT